MGKTSNLIRAAAFLAVFCLIFIRVQELVTPDYNWPVNGTRQGNNIRGLYAEPEDDLQVLWIGGSHMRCGLSPMVVYRESGIRSYNLATDAQTISLSLSRLELALEKHNPQMVVLDASSILISQASDKKEAQWRLVMDSIRWSRLRDKFKLIDAYCRLNGLGWDEKLNGMLPLLRYHQHYLLEQDDYYINAGESTSFTKGYSFLSTRVASKNPQGDLVPLDEEAFVGNADAIEKYGQRLEINRPIVDRIRALCESKGCELLLTKIPVNASAKSYNSYWSREKHELIAAFAEEIGCRFVDLNYEDVGMDWTNDTKDQGRHLNSSGAKKVSRFLGRWLLENCAFDDSAGAGTAEKWDRQLDLYEFEEAFYDMRLTYDPDAYLQFLSQGDYTVFVAGSGPIKAVLGEASQQALAALAGVEEPDAWSDRDACHLAVGSAGVCVAEASDAKKCAAQGELADGKHFSISCAGGESSVEIGSLTFKNKGDALQIVVYSNVLRCVVDCVTFSAGTTIGMTHDLKTARTSFNKAQYRYETEAMKGI